MTAPPPSPREPGREGRPGTGGAAGRYTPRPGAAPLPRMIAAQTALETRMLLRHGEQLLLAWTQWQEDQPRVVTARLPLADLPAR